MPYIAPEELLDAPMGLHIDEFTLGDLEAACTRASTIVDGYKRTSFDYRDVADEQSFWDGQDFRFWTQFVPIRSVKALRIIMGKAGGVERDLPFSPGDIQWSRDMGSGQATGFSVQAYLYTPFVGFAEPMLSVDYTSGFDASQVDSAGAVVQADPRVTDGIANPYPAWLKTATVAVATKLLEEAHARKAGLQGVDRVTIGPMAFSRYAVRNQRLEGWMPQLATEILDGVFQDATVWVGAG